MLSRISVSKFFNLACELLFPLRRIIPPLLWVTSVHVIDRRHEDIEDAGVVKPIVDLAKFSVELNRVLADQVLRFPDSQLLKISRHGWTDIDDLVKLRNRFPVGHVICFFGHGLIQRQETELANTPICEPRKTRFSQWLM